MNATPSRHGMKWFKLYSEIKDDAKMLELDDHQFRVWVNFLAVASESSDRGVVTYHSLRGLAASLRTDEAKLASALELFVSLGMIEHAEQRVTIAKWGERQYDKPSDTPEETRARKRRSRNPKTEVTPESRDVTPLSRASHATEKNREEEIREEDPPMTGEPGEGNRVSSVTASIDVRPESRSITQTLDDGTTITDTALLAADLVHAKDLPRELIEPVRAWLDTHEGKVGNPHDYAELNARLTRYGAERLTAAIRELGNRKWHSIKSLDKLLADVPAPTHSVTKPRPQFL